MSVSSVSLSSDANVRYQRLAQEYTKLRAQAKVLREGVIEERGKVDKLTEDLKSKEAVIRRLQSENESLTFRNDQLVRRVETFQFEPQSTPHSSKKSAATKAHPTPPNNLDSLARIELLEQELQRKLEQNEKLVSELAENERQHAVEMAEMSEKLAKEMRKLEDEVKRMRMRTTVNSNKENGKNEVELTKIEEKREEVEVIGSPEPPESQDEARIMVAEATKGTFSALNNVFTLLQQRCEIYPYDATMEPLPAHVVKLSSEYAQASRLFSGLVEITESIIADSVFEPDEQLPIITSKCRLISQHCQKMLKDLFSRMIGEENRVTWCTAALNKLNNHWESLVLNLFEVFEKITGNLENLTSSNQSEASSNLLDSLDELDSLSSQLLECFQKRWIYEARFPTTTNRMRCVGNALEAALQMMSQETSKLAARTKRVKFMEEERKRRAEEAKRMEAEIEKEVLEKKLREEAVALMSTPKIIAPSKPQTEDPYNPFFDENEEEDTSQEPLESADTTITSPEPTEDFNASRNSGMSKNSSENHPPDHLHSEIRLLTSRNKELQKERDKLFVDNSLVKRKLEIALQSSEKEKNSDEKQKTDLDQIWEIGMERRDEWVQRVQKAEKALRFYEIEFELLLRHELASEEHLKQVLSELESVSQKNHRLEDELESVRRSYESQLGDLSEHLATLVKDREKEKESNKSRGSLKSFFNKS
ncbi:unnamed protein product [Caenorhabditis brenneri]